jgi:CBS domain-containing protein
LAVIERTIMRRHAVVRVTWDDETKVWYVEDSGDIQGLVTEADTLEALRERIRVIAADLLSDEPDHPPAAGPSMARSSLGTPPMLC